MRGATIDTVATDTRNEISTHTPHAGRDKDMVLQIAKQLISTHTPHAGRDILEAELTSSPLDFYSHAPCGARRLSHG